MLEQLSNMLKTLGLSSRTKRRVGRERKERRETGETRSKHPGERGRGGCGKEERKGNSP